MDYRGSQPPLVPTRLPPFTTALPDSVDIPGESIPRRHPRAVNGLISRPSQDVGTVFDIVVRGARDFPCRMAAAYRSLRKLHIDDCTPNSAGMDKQYYELSPFVYVSYRDYRDMVLEASSGLHKLGMARHDKLYFFGTTSLPWITMSHACAAQSMTMVTAYDTLGEAAVEHSLLQTKASVIYTDPHLLKVISRVIPKSAVHTIIVNGDCIFASGDEEDAFRRDHPRIQVVNFRRVLEMGRKHVIAPSPASPEDLYCIMYTSGSTGKPKGVCITHKAFIASVAGALACLDECIGENDILLSYLPLAHIMELVTENAALFAGITLGYSSPRTLTDISVRNCRGDIRELRPTIMIGVPQVWETIRKTILSRLQSANFALRSTFWAGYTFKALMVKSGLPFGEVFDRVLFSKVREATGGRLRVIMNGASGISSSTKEFLSLTVAPMLVGYGLTETCAAGSLGCPLEYSARSIGPVSACIEVKLVSVPHLGYYTDDVTVAQGEIVGESVMTEYFEDTEATSQAFTPDGWFRTGDIGEFDEVGHLRVIDRIKNLVKMLGGEYIALDKVEMSYRTSPAVSNVMVHADSMHRRPIAIVEPNKNILHHRAAKLGLLGHDVHRNLDLRKSFLEDLREAGNASGLVSMELVTGVIISDIDWTTESGLVTATRKLKRHAIYAKFKTEIDECYKTEVS